MRSGRATILALDTRRVPALLQKTRLVDDQNRIWTAQLFHNVMAQLIPRSVCIPTSPVQQMLHPIGAAWPIHSANCQPFLRSQPLNKPCKYARLRARGSERANNSAISPCARNNSPFHPARRFSITHAGESHGGTCAALPRIHTVMASDIDPRLEAPGALWGITAGHLIPCQNGHVQNLVGRGASAFAAHFDDAWETESNE